MKHSVDSLGADTCHLLALVHAIAGCDTTLRMFGIGKGVPLKQLQETGRNILQK